MNKGHSLGHEWQVASSKCSQQTPLPYRTPHDRVWFFSPLRQGKFLQLDTELQPAWLKNFPGWAFVICICVYIFALHVNIRRWATLNISYESCLNPLDVDLYYLLYFLKDFIYLFLDRGREGEREGEKHWCARDTSTSCLSHGPNWGPGWQPRHMP